MEDHIDRKRSAPDEEVLQVFNINKEVKRIKFTRRSDGSNTVKIPYLESMPAYQ